MHIPAQECVDPSFLICGQDRAQSAHQVEERIGRACKHVLEEKEAAVAKRPCSEPLILGDIRWQVLAVDHVLTRDEAYQLATSLEYRRQQYPEKCLQDTHFQELTARCARALRNPYVCYDPEHQTWYQLPTASTRTAQQAQQTLLAIDKVRQGQLTFPDKAKPYLGGIALSCQESLKNFQNLPEDLLRLITSFLSFHDLQLQILHQLPLCSWITHKIIQTAWLAKVFSTAPKTFDTYASLDKYVKSTVIANKSWQGILITPQELHHQFFIELIRQYGKAFKECAWIFNVATRLRYVRIIPVLLSQLEGIAITDKKTLNQSLPSLGCPLLHAAVRYGETQLVQRLLQHGAHVNRRDRHFRTALHIAAQYSQIGAAMVLVACEGVEQEARTNKGQTPLHIAAQHSPTMTQWLVDRRVHVNLQDSNERCALHEATEHGTLTSVRSLLRQPDIDVNLKDINDLAPLHIAVARREMNIIRALVEAGHAELTLPGGEYEDTPLHQAVEQDSRDIASYLIARGGQVVLEARNALGNTPLRAAVEAGNLDMVIALLQHVDLDVVDIDGYSLLYTAINMGRIHVLRYLIEHARCNVNTRNQDDATPLHYAAEQGDVECLRYLLGIPGIEVNAVDSDHHTPLHVAILQHRELAACILIEHDNINLQIGNLQNSTPLHMAAMGGRFNLVIELLQRGADPYALNTQGEMAWHCAVRTGYIGVATYLQVYTAWFQLTVGWYPGVYF